MHEQHNHTNLTLPTPTRVPKRGDVEIGYAYAYYNLFVASCLLVVAGSITRISEAHVCVCVYLYSLKSLN